MASQVTTPRPVIRLAIANDYEVVIAGVTALLAAERIDIIETDASLPVITDVDVVLYDTFGQVQGKGIDLEDLLRAGTAKVVVYSWKRGPQLIAQALERGASGYLFKALTGPEIIEALERVMDGETVVLLGDHEPLSAALPGDWPGRSAGLSPRESEILALITQGLSNQEIADRAYLSINTVKTFIRSAYRKIGVQRRTQALLWCVEHGFTPDTKRTIDPARELRHLASQPVA